jgi:organic hydroperoxide reductase OsmC/OhrA
MATYTTKSFSTQDDEQLKMTAQGKDDFTVTAPVEFNGPEGFWTPEDLFSASISSCYILTFRNLAKFKKLEWENIEVIVDALLEKTDSGYRFTKATISPRLTICCKSDADPYLSLLEKAKEHCLVTKSMNTEFTLKPKVIVKSK